jgi:hypothetical protein
MRQYIFPFAAPAIPGTTNLINPSSEHQVFIPTDHEYIVSMHALNSWTFQSHMNCKATALANAINAALDFQRGNTLISSRDVEYVMKHRDRVEATRLYQRRILPLVNNNETELELMITAIVCPCQVG